MSERVHARDQVLDHLELVRHLGAAEDRDERPLGMLEHPAQVLDFLRHQQAGRSLADVMDDALGRRVRAMRGPERVVDVDVGERGKLLARTPGRSSLPRAWKRRFSSRMTPPVPAFAIACAAGSPMQSRRTRQAGRGAPTAATRPAGASTRDSVCPSAGRGATPESRSRPDRARSGSSAGTRGCACPPRSARP